MDRCEGSANGSSSYDDVFLELFQLQEIFAKDVAIDLNPGLAGVEVLD